MFNEKRNLLFQNYNRARHYFIEHPDALIQIEHYICCLTNDIINTNYLEIEHDYNEATYLNALWANYPPDDRGRLPIGDQIPWIEVGEQSVGHKLSRFISRNYKISEVGLPSGADNRFVLYSDDILHITNGLTNCAFVHLDIKSVGPRDNFDHTVISPYQVSGDGIWAHPNQNLKNSTMTAFGKRVSHPFYPAISPIYPLTNGDIAPTIHLFVKPVYRMLSMSSDDKKGQPLDSVKSICVPNGLLLTCNPNYLSSYPGLFFPGKDDRNKDFHKTRVRVSFSILQQIADWRVCEFSN
ncbi:MAG: BglI family type II restriction endonuclease [Faecalibacterium sp.]